MLDFISWTDFFLFVGILTLVWILYVFKDDILAKGRPGKSPPTKRIWQVAENDPPLAAAANPQQHEQASRQDQPANWDPQEQDDSDAQFMALETLIDDLQETIAGCEPETAKEALLAQLQEQVARYPALAQPAFKAVVHNFIYQASAKRFSIDITKADTDALWQPLTA